MNKKILITIILGIFLFSFASATMNYPVNEQVNITAVCLNNGFCSDLAICNMTIQEPSGDFIIDNVGMVDGGSFYYTNITTGEMGTHIVSGFCKDGSIYRNIEYSFEVTPNGDSLSLSNSVLVLGFIFLLLLLFIGVVFGAVAIPSNDEKDDAGNIINKGMTKYFKPILFMVAWGLMLGILFVSSNVALAYLNFGMFGKFLFMMFQIQMWLTFPLIMVWFIWIFVSIFQHNETKKMLERGVDIGEI